MHRIPRNRALAAAAVTVALWAGPAMTPPALAASTVTATSGVNVRSGPGLDRAIIGSLAQGQTVPALGPSVNGWTPVEYRGATAYVSSAYLTASSTGTKVTRETTAALNVRSGPGTGYSVLRTLATRTAVQLTGSEQNGFAQLVGGGWVSTSYLTSPVATAPVSPGGATTAMVTSDALNFRSGPSTNDSVLRVLPKATAVQATGRTSGSFSEITVGGQTGWAHQSWLIAAGQPIPAPTPAPAPTQPTPTPTAPVATGTRYATVALNIRTTPNFDRAPVGFVPVGSPLQVTSVANGAWTQVIHLGVLRWAYTSYLSATAPGTTVPAPSQGLPGLVPAANAAVAAIRATFPQLSTIYGVRNAGVGSDHTEGRAVDFMIPSYWSNPQLGTQVAAYLQAHAKELDVKYIIWQQRIWLADWPQQGWEYMADRGSDTQNHYDHVHLSVH